MPKDFLDPRPEEDDGVDFENLIKPKPVVIKMKRSEIENLAFTDDNDKQQFLFNLENHVEIEEDMVDDSHPGEGTDDEVETYEESEQPRTFREALEHLINSYSMENGSDTPDFILAEYLAMQLSVFDHTTKARENWYGRGLDAVPLGGQPAQDVPETIESKTNEEAYSNYKAPDNIESRKPANAEASATFGTPSAGLVIGVDEE